MQKSYLISKNKIVHCCRKCNREEYPFINSDNYLLQDESETAPIKKS